MQFLSGKDISFTATILTEDDRLFDNCSSIAMAWISSNEVAEQVILSNFPQKLAKWEGQLKNARTLKLLDAEGLSCFV